MKKANFIFAFVIIFSVNTFSQTYNIAPEAGMNISLFGKSDVGYNAQLAYHAGGLYRYKLNDKMFLSAGLYFNQKKIRYSNSYSQSNLLLEEMFAMIGMDSLFNLNSEVTTEGRIKQHFIEMPLLFTYQHKRTNFMAGPYMGYLLWANTNEVIETRFPLSQTVDVASLVGGGPQGALINSFLPPPYTREVNSSSSSSGLRVLDIGFTAGVGYEYERLCFNMYYSQGIFDYRSSRGSSDTFTTFKMIRFSTCYWFELKCKKKDAPKDPE